MIKDSPATVKSFVHGRGTAESRWARFGPYYAMFPMDFAYDVITRYSKPEDYVLDPFAGRGSGLFAAASLGRVACGIEINPVGWLYSKVKLSPAPIEQVKKRLLAVADASKTPKTRCSGLPDFFRYCFEDDVLKFLMMAREILNWESDNTDSTLMAFILHYLHGKKGQSLSNQMSMVKAMSPRYSIDWWTKKGLTEPPSIDVLSFFEKRLEWRFQKGAPSFQGSRAILGDCVVELAELAQEATNNKGKYSLLFTSPPYQGVTNYFTDQWLRYWMLGGSAQPKTDSGKHKKRFNSETEYLELLDDVFLLCKGLMKDDAIIYVRTDSRKFTFDATCAALTKHFPSHQFSQKDDKCEKLSQTELYNNSKRKPHEVDIILKPYKASGIQAKN